MRLSLRSGLASRYSMLGPIMTVKCQSQKWVMLCLAFSRAVLGSTSGFLDQFRETRFDLYIQSVLHVRQPEYRRSYERVYACCSLLATPTISS